MEPLPFQHIEEVCVSSCVKLIGSVDGHSSVKIEIDQSPVENSGSNLGFYIIAD